MIWRANTPTYDEVVLYLKQVRRDVVERAQAWKDNGDAGSARRRQPRKLKLHPMEPRLRR